MTYLQRVEFHPALGKGPDLRSAFEQRVKNYHANGVSVTLSLQLLGGESGNPYILLFRHEDLDAFEVTRRRNQSDPAFAEFQAQIAGLVSRPVVVSLSETLIANPSTPALTAPFFVQRNQSYPVPGNGPALRALLEERVKGFQSAGLRSNLTTSVFGGDDRPFHSVSTSFQHLKDLDEFRHRNQSDAAFGERTRKIQALIRQPANISLREVLIPNPS